MSLEAEIGLKDIYLQLGKMEGLLTGITGKIDSHERKLEQHDDEIHALKTFQTNTEKIDGQKSKSNERMLKIIAIGISLLSVGGGILYNKTSSIEQKTNVALNQSYIADRQALAADKESEGK